MHQFRTALDHAIWVFAVGSGISDDRRIQFPVCKDKQTFAKTALTALRGVPSAAIDCIEKAQPFNATPPEIATLALLHDLDNSDKHRSHALIANAILVGNSLTFGGELKADIKVLLNAKSPDGFFHGVEHGEHLAWIEYESPEEEPALNVSAETTVVFSYDRLGPHERYPLIEALVNLGRFSHQRIEELSQVWITP